MFSFIETKFVSPTLQVYCGAHGRTVIFAETKKDVNELALNSSLKQVSEESSFVFCLLFASRFTNLQNY